MDALDGKAKFYLFMQEYDGQPWYMDAMEAQTIAAALIEAEQHTIGTKEDHGGVVIDSDEPNDELKMFIAAFSDVVILPVQDWVATYNGWKDEEKAKEKEAAERAELAVGV